jgi:hypothetical protein
MLLCHFLLNLLCRYHSNAMFKLTGYFVKFELGNWTNCHFLQSPAIDMCRHHELARCLLKKDPWCARLRVKKKSFWRQGIVTVSSIYQDTFNVINWSSSVLACEILHRKTKARCCWSLSPLAEAQTNWGFSGVHWKG